jgi:heme-degrading monooxygenase HmoA
VYARLTTVVFSSDEPDPAGQIFEKILPMVESLDGFQAMVMLSGREEHSLAALTLWETEAALAAAEPVLEGVKKAETAHRHIASKRTVRFQVAGFKLASSG